MYAFDSRLAKVAGQFQCSQKHEPILFRSPPLTNLSRVIQNVQPYAESSRFDARWIFERSRKCTFSVDGAKSYAADGKACIELAYISYT
jgi:hypothetical protein